MSKQDSAHIEPDCICFWVPEYLWTTHYGAAEPGSTQEPNIECRVHFSDADREFAYAPAPVGAAEHTDPWVSPESFS